MCGKVQVRLPLCPTSPASPSRTCLLSVLKCLRWRHRKLAHIGAELRLTCFTAGFANNGNPTAAMDDASKLLEPLPLLRLLRRRRRQWATKQLKSVCFVLGTARKKVVARPSNEQGSALQALHAWTLPPLHLSRLASAIRRAFN